MQCSCGKDNAPDAKFCKNCGTPVQTSYVKAESQVNSCPSCNVQLKPNTKFCGKCGHKFGNSTELNPALPPIEQALPVVDVEPEEVAVQLLNNEVVSAQVAVDIKAEGVGASKGNKKFTIIGAVLFVMAMIAVAGWYFILASEKDVPAIETNEPSATKSDAAPVISPELIKKATANVPSSYLGKTAKLGTMLGVYEMESLRQTKNFMILEGFDDERRQLIVVTNLVSKVLDTKEITEINKAFISSKEACVVNKKPYAGVYVVATLKQLTQPSEIWKLTEDGRLINASVENLECAYYPECEPESDVCFNLGYNDKRKQELSKESAAKQSVAKTKVQAKKEPAKESVPSIAIQQNEQSATSPAATTAEPAPTLQQEVTQEEPKKKKKNFFEQLEDSVKNGATERTCTEAQRVLNQCN